MKLHKICEMWQCHHHHHHHHLFARKMAFKNKQVHVVLRTSYRARETVAATPLLKLTFSLHTDGHVTKWCWWLSIEVCSRLLALAVVSTLVKVTIQNFNNRLVELLVQDQRLSSLSWPAKQSGLCRSVEKSGYASVRTESIALKGRRHSSRRCKL